MARRPFPITKYMHFSSQLMSTARCYEYGMKVENCWNDFLVIFETRQGIRNMKHLPFIIMNKWWF
jgi:hypothetical protein